MTFLLVLALAAADPLPSADARASTLRAQARDALGGEPALASVHGLSLQGHFTSPLFGQAVSAAPARRFEVGANLSF